MLHHIRMLTRYAAWANKLLYEHIAQMPESALTKAQPIVFGSIIRTLNHVYAMDLVWQAHLLGTAHGFTTRNPVEHPPFSALRARQAELDEWYVRYATTLTEFAANEVVEFRFIGGDASSMTRLAILLHVVNHTTYHRGHLADMIYYLSDVPPTTDLPVFLRQDSGID